ncbi:LPS-assembly protein [Monaibacterium marinum]|uniref:LPS-assembly protein LptD n=1 Tax=Pontivivens marinum TaxID=1690039 RepID=A0A2C9CQY9_9RHOB|nr:LPS assembly protein LptD [Monaibacterium marinum]SOH93662.1 LPS-assembly protein [Monaibacterium marinum]
MAIAVPSFAQQNDRVALVADRISVDAETGALIAEGNVTIIRGETTLQTDRLIYNETDGTVSVPAAMTIQQGDALVLYADFAELDSGLQAGVIAGARALIDNQLQVAATTAQQVDGRFTVMNQIVASSCTICEENPVPIWSIRAERVVRDSTELEFHYENAVFELFGVPVLYLPYFRHPDPSVDRASGFLSPEFNSSDIYGFGFKLPYHIVIDDSSDATLTPFTTAEEGVLLEAEYRRVFDRGELELSGVSKLQSDDVGDMRGYLSAVGHYELGFDVVGRIDMTLLSDDAFLTAFGYSDDDRITSELSLEKFEQNSFWTVSTVYFDSLRTTESQDTVPMILPEAEYRQSFDLGTARAEVNADILSYTRTRGRDLSRATVGAGLDQSYVTEPGLVLRGFADVSGDIYSVRNDATLGDVDETRLRSTVGMEFRMPFVRRTAELTQIVEPILQLVHGEQSGNINDIPNEDSVLVEFDETSLFSTNRFPGTDRYETGTYANVGLRYESITPSGRNLTGTVGRVFRDKPLASFANSTGLDGLNSDYVVAFGYDATDTISFSGSALADDDFELSRTELQFDYTGADVSFSSTYVYLRADATSVVDRAELVMDMEYQIDDNWSGELGFRRDLENDAFISADAGLTWGNECATFEFSVSRRFTTSNNVEPSTEFGLTMRLAGLGTQGDAAERRRRSCGI